MILERDRQCDLPDQRAAPEGIMSVPSPDNPFIVMKEIKTPLLYPVSA